jgi:hypothetical protein
MLAFVGALAITLLAASLTSVMLSGAKVAPEVSFAGRALSIA